MAKTGDPRKRLEAVDAQIAELEGQVNAGAAPPAAAGQQLDTLRQQRRQLKEQVQQAGPPVQAQAQAQDQDEEKEGGEEPPKAQRRR